MVDLSHGTRRLDFANTAKRLPEKLEKRGVEKNVNDTARILWWYRPCYRYDHRRYLCFWYQPLKPCGVSHMSWIARHMGSIARCKYSLGDKLKRRKVILCLTWLLSLTWLVNASESLPLYRKRCDTLGPTETALKGRFCKVQVVLLSSLKRMKIF